MISLHNMWNSVVAGDAIKYLTVDQISTVFLIHFCTQVRYAVTEQQLSIIVQNCSYCTFKIEIVPKDMGNEDLRAHTEVQTHTHTHTHTHTLRTAGDSGKGGGLFIITKTGHTHSPLLAHPHTHKGKPLPSPWLHFLAPLKSFLETQEKL